MLLQLTCKLIKNEASPHRWVFFASWEGWDKKCQREPRAESFVNAERATHTEAEWPDWFFWDQKLKIWFFYNLNGFGLAFFLVTLFSKFGFFLVFFVKIWCFWLFLGQKMEMSSSKRQNLANGFPGSEKIWPPCTEAAAQWAMTPWELHDRLGVYQVLSQSLYGVYCTIFFQNLMFRLWKIIEASFIYLVFSIKST